MNNNEQYSLKRSGKVYKTLSWFSTFSLTLWLVTRDGYNEELNCLTNLCSFLRTIVFLVLFLLLCTTTVVLSIYSLFDSFASITESTNFFLNTATVFKWIFPLTILIGFILTGFFHILNKISDTRKVKESLIKKKKEPNIFIQSIKDRHNKVCRSFNIKN